MDSRRSRLRAVSRRSLAAGSAAVCALSLAMNAPAYAAPGPGPTRLEAARTPSVRNVRPVPARFQQPPDAARSSYQAKATIWPSAAEATVTLAAGGRAKVASSPVWLEGGRGSAKVRVIDHASAERAGVRGTMMVVTPTEKGKTRVGLDYTGFAEAYGGNFGSRLRLVTLPACATTTPETAACRVPTALGSTNDSRSRSVSAEVALTGPTVLAATTDPGSDGGAGGTYAASDLKPSGSWSGGGSSGTFTYQVPVNLPPGPSPVAPKLAVAYDSGATDGQTASTQAQSSWIGDGWATPQSYIEQTFASCRDKPEGRDSPKATDDLCYAGPVLTLSLNGSTSRLVYDKDTDEWRPESDSGELITRGPATFDNGSRANDKRYWQVITRDGMVYQFGRNRLPGWNADRPVTNSVDLVPVYSPHASGPCYQSSGFADSFCDMARRWSLDYVQDVHGNAMTYYYTQEVNRYGRNLGATDDDYVRDSFLTRIEYGFTGGNVYATAPDKVEFAVENRCESACGALSESTKAKYPDVPFDLVCPDKTDCDAFAPSFFSTKRLASITASQWNATSQKAAPVDAYVFDQSFPSTQDGTSPTLWLKSITRTGYAPPEQGTSTQLPPITFASIKLPNRVDTLSGYPSFYRHRIFKVTTETGSTIGPEYLLPEPCGATKPAPASNTRSCFPVRWTPAGRSEPILDWFNKYAVGRVTQDDPTGRAPATVTDYAYLDGAAWHYDDNELIKAKHRTYGQFRGYAKVRTLTGDGAVDRRTMGETTYYRGMSRDNGGAAATVTDSAGGAHDDRNELAGSVLEDTTYRGENGAVESSTVNAYWVSGATATRSRTGLAALTANKVATALTYSRQAIAGTGSPTWRYTQVDNSYNDDVSSPYFGLLEASYSHTVPADPAYDQCTLTGYAPVNRDKNLVGLVSQTETLAKACAGFTRGTPPTVPGTLNTLRAPAEVSRPAQTVSATRTFYDDTDWGTTFPQRTAPTRGLTTMTQQAKDYVDGAYVWQTGGRSTFDGIGRPVDSYDGEGYHTVTRYTANSAGLTIGGSVTNALGHVVRTTIEPSRGVTLTSVGVNNEITTQTYDALGRTTAVWFGSRPTNLPAHETYDYVVSRTGVSSTTTRKLNDLNAYRDVSVVLYDGQLRPRQTQTSTPASGRLVTDTFYDSRGWVRATYNAWHDKDNTPSGGAIVSSDTLGTESYDQTMNTYDGLGRAVVVTKAAQLIPVSKVTTVYDGDRVTVIPPDGATATTTITDPVDRTAALVQYTARPTLTVPADTFLGRFTVSGGTTTTSRYGYDTRGNQATVTDAEDNTWTTEFNLLGQVSKKTDPDSGSTTGIRYDKNSNLLESTDARGRTISSTYDALNRKTATHAAATDAQSDANRTASWVYDNSDAALTVPNAKGRLTSSTAYWDGNAYKTQVLGYAVNGASTGERITIPEAEGSLRGTYEFSRSYTTNRSLLFRESWPSKGGLPAENLTHFYDSLDMPTVYGGTYQYSGGVAYDAYRRVSSVLIGKDPQSGRFSKVYDPHTGRLTEQQVTFGTTTKVTAEEQRYEYDKAGNLEKQRTIRTAAGGVGETQCFDYDELVRLTQAWTATDDCATRPTAAQHGMVDNTIGGGSAYWTSWSFDALGNRTGQTQHNLTGGSDSTTSYAYDGNSANQPHTLTSTTSTAPDPGTSFAYDKSGNMTTRNAGNGPQTLTWNESGQLTKVSGPAGDTTSIYTGDGQLLLQKDPTNTTLYLPGQQHVLDKTTGTVTGTRYLAVPGGALAIRTGSGTNYTFALTDGHGSPTLYFDNQVLNPKWRQYSPYGEARGAAGTYPDNRGFLNKPANATTGLTRMGARDYDPVTGTFISLDPLQDKENPQQWQGYSYATNNPITYADPSGMVPITDEQYAGSGGTPTRTPSSPPTGHPSQRRGNNTARHERQTANDVRNERVSLRKETMDGINARGGLMTKAITLGSLEEFAMRSTHNWEFLCSSESGRTTEQCENTNPYLNKNVKEVLFVGAGIMAAVALPACIIVPYICAAVIYDYAAGEVTAASTGSLISASGMIGGASLLNLAGKGASAAGKGGGIASALRKACSFSGDTEVLMADGTTEPIDEIDPGEVVYAADPETGAQGGRTVTASWAHGDELLDLKLSVGSVTTTINHPFWNATDRLWERADALDRGDRVVTRAGFGTVEGLMVRTAHPGTAYNLTVDDLHTYYVLAGNTPVLVHNCGGATVDPGKFDYMFGKVASNSHNAARSAQNQAQFAKVGVYNNAEGRGLLQSHFDEVVGSDSNVMRTFTNDHGEFQIRDSLFAGPGGFLHLETTWQVTGDGLRLTTVIPRGGG
ncbi:RHS repeat-associated core domain-containing protein [Actinoplanes sp. NPDC051470]|uniref:RHS repeat-associated core domain-containing protein n=1 Tax=Actinoplanes sp. NPDC051470 TaxID=3157224 RepID=UPI003434A1BA